MEAINQVINFADVIFERLPPHITPIESTALTVSVVVLSVFFAAPSRPVEIVGAVALAGGFILLAPNYAIVLFVVGCGLVGLVRSRRRSVVMQKQLAKIGHAIQQLELAENRRFIQSLNSASPPADQIHQQDAPSIMPSEQVDEAATSVELRVVKSNHQN